MDGGAGRPEQALRSSIAPLLIANAIGRQRWTGDRIVEIARAAKLNDYWMTAKDYHDADMLIY
jgi:hypothetical protein